MKTKNKWKTKKCGRCGEEHNNYSGKLDSKGIEYVICGSTNNRMNVRTEGFAKDSVLFSTAWIQES